MTENEAVRNARRRGEILVILKRAHPNWVRTETIRNTLAKLGVFVELQSVLSNLVWLSDRGYISTERRKGDPARVSVELAQILPKGFDLIDQNNDVNDDGVEF